MFGATLAVICLIAWDDNADPKNPSPPETQYKTLAARYETAYQDFLNASRSAKTPEDAKTVRTHPGRDPRAFTRDFMALAEKYPRTRAAEDSLIWVCSHSFGTRECEVAKQALIREHLRSARVGTALGFQGHYSDWFEGTEAFLRAYSTQSPHREIRGIACYWLARSQLKRASVARGFQKDRQLGQRHPSAERFAEVYGPDWAERLRRLDPDMLERESETLFERVARYYADIPHNDKRHLPGTLGEAALAYLHERHDLAVGQQPPEFEGKDLDGRRLRLAEFRGKVVVLDFGSHFYCGACRETYPQMRAMTKRLRDRPFSIVSINAEPEKQIKELRDAWAAEKNTWPCVFDGTWEGPIQKAWNIDRFPTIYVLDGKGRIRFKNIFGPDLDAAVDALLKETPHK